MPSISPRPRPRTNRAKPWAQQCAILSPTVTPLLSSRASPHPPPARTLWSNENTRLTQAKSMGSWEPAWSRSSRAGQQSGREDSIAARQVADTVSRIHPISSWTVERRAALRRPRETLNKIPAAAAWFMLDGGGRICASKPHASRPIARPFVNESYVILFRKQQRHGQRCQAGIGNLFSFTALIITCLLPVVCIAYIARRARESKGGDKQARKHSRRTRQFERYLQAPRSRHHRTTGLPSCLLQGPYSPGHGSMGSRLWWFKIAYPRMDALCGNETPGS